MRGHIFVAAVLILATAAITDGIGLGDVYRMFKHGVNATCVGIPDFVKDKIIPLKCVQCENNLWSFKGDLNLMSLGRCLRNGGDTVPINIFGLFASILVSLFFYRN